MRMGWVSSLITMCASFVQAIEIAVVLSAVGPGQGAMAVHALPVLLIEGEVVLGKNAVGVVFEMCASFMRCMLFESASY